MMEEVEQFWAMLGDKGDELNGQLQDSQGG
jgi:hypothetical protein